MRHLLLRPALLVFQPTVGTAVNAATFSREWSSVRASIGLPARWGIHMLRHYFATVHIHAGASVKTVQMALGHSAPTATSTPGPGR